MTSQDSFDVFCPNCNIMVEGKIIASGLGGKKHYDDLPDILAFAEVEYYGDYYHVCLCGRCEQAFLLRQSHFSFLGDSTVSKTEETILYPAIKNIDIKEIPRIIKSPYEQACQCFTAALYEPCMLMCRKCLEAICAYKGVTVGTLHSKLKTLFDNGDLDHRFYDWTQEIRNLGNVAAHEFGENVTKDDARDILDFTEALLIYMFSLISKFEAFQSRRNTQKPS